TFSVFMNVSSRGCIDRLALTYSAGTLTLNFTIKHVVASRWRGWIAWQSSVAQLWSAETPAVPDTVVFSLPIANVPQIGNVAVLTMMSSDSYGLMCGDLKMVDTGGLGASAPALMNLLRSRAIN